MLALEVGSIFEKAVNINMAWGRLALVWVSKAVVTQQSRPKGRVYCCTTRHRRTLPPVYQAAPQPATCQVNTAQPRSLQRCDIQRVPPYDFLPIARLKRQLESARGIIKTVAKGETSDGTSGNKRLRLGGAGGRDGGASRASALTRCVCM